MDIINRTNSQLVMITWEEQKEKECVRERKKRRKKRKKRGKRERDGITDTVRYCATGTAPQGGYGISYSGCSSGRNLG